ncbi:MAG: hypothetical protein O6951_07925 [Actinobacteria bacterium]|nr:hypothetical protein [Actinomycetota bacterium]
MEWLRNPSVLLRVGQGLTALGLVIVLVGIAGNLLNDDGGTPTAANTTTTTTTSPTTTTTTSPTTTTTTSPTTTTTTSPTTTTTTIVQPESVEEFVVLFALAIGAGDIEFLLDRLHPAAVGGFGLDLCRNWIEAEILQLGDYQLTGPAEGPRDQSFTTPAGTGTIEDAYSAPVSFTFQGQLFDAEGDFALIGIEMYWLGQCR